MCTIASATGSDNNVASTVETATISLSGEGQQASQMFTLTEGLSIFTMKYSGSSNFGVWLMDRNGKKVELLANVIGDSNGAKAVGISSLVIIFWILRRMVRGRGYNSAKTADRAERARFI